jgi:TrpR-related protein YerC/YecD
MEYRYRIQNSELDDLFEVILSLQSKEECYRFFEDLCTVNELESFGQRLKVAKMLYEKRTYHDIEKETGISAATISKVSKSMNYGPGGYELALARLREKEQK